MPAAREVFGTLELFEMIMLEVDMKTILLSQRVSREFQDKIDVSTPLQRKLWFLPRLETATTTATTTETTANSDTAATTTATATPTKPAKRDLNPMIFDKRHKLFIKDLYLWQSSTLRGASVCSTIVDIHYFSLGHARAIKPGSWSRMIVVQQHAENIAWCLGYLEGPRLSPLGKRVAGRQIEFALKYDGPPPTLGQLRCDLLERYAAVKVRRV